MTLSNNQSSHLPANDFVCGVIEGFFGRPWSWQARRDYTDFLLQYGFDSYIYAPKSDLYLRNHWRQLWPASTLDALCALSKHYQRANLRFGIGLSPYGLMDHYGSAERQQLQQKLVQINQVNPAILAILFDDMPGDKPHLAQRQLQIIDDIVAWSDADHYLFCPTYYSFDPLLEKLFGNMPADYLTTLGEQLPTNIGVFWTGAKVISPRFTHSDIEQAANLIKRPPVLWDNYWANDGERISRYLPLKPCTGRPRALQKWTAGHYVNPMNQPCLSQLPLITLADHYANEHSQSAEQLWQHALASIDLPGLRAALARDSALFANEGLDALIARDKVNLQEDYQRFNHPAAREVVAWLNGEYAFDPACLTG